MLIVCSIVYNGETMFSYLKINFTWVSKEEAWSAMQNDSVMQNKGVNNSVNFMFYVPEFGHPCVNALLIIFFFWKIELMQIFQF